MSILVYRLGAQSPKEGQGRIFFEREQDYLVDRGVPKSPSNEVLMEIGLFFC